MEKKDTIIISKEDDLKNDTKGIILKRNMDFSTLVEDNAELKAIYAKKFWEINEEEINKFPKVKMNIVEKNNTFSRTTTRYIRLHFAEGVYVERELRSAKSEEAILRMAYPELFIRPKTKADIKYVDVPCKFFAYKKDDGKFTYQYYAEIYPGIYLGTKNNYLNDNQLKIMLIKNTNYRFCLVDRKQAETEYLVED